MPQTRKFRLALWTGLAISCFFAVEAQGGGGHSPSQLQYQVVLIDEPDSTVRSEGSGPVPASGIFHSSGYAYGEQCRGIGGGGGPWQDALLLRFRHGKPLPKELQDVSPRVAYNGSFYVHRDTEAGIIELRAVLSVYHFRGKTQHGLHYDVTILDTTCTVPPGHPVRLLAFQNNCPHLLALYVRLVESTQTFRQDMTSDFRKVLEKLHPEHIPVNFHLRYEQRDSSTGRVVRLLSAKQINFDPTDPFVFRFANPIPPELEAYPEKWPEYRIAGYLVPLERKGDSLRCVLLLQQGLGHGGNLRASMFTYKKLTLPNGKLVRIVLQTPKLSVAIPLPDRSGQYLRVRLRNGLLKGVREELYVQAYF